MRKWINSLFKVIYRRRYRSIRHYMEHPHEVQLALFRQLISTARHTEWGRRYDFRNIKNPETFAGQVPVQDYDSLKPYIQRMMYGEKDVLWSGQVRWFSKSSGTTSDRSKFIPISAQNLKENHQRGGWDTTTLFYHNRPDARLMELKSMLMGGSLSRFEPYPRTMIGDVSAILMDRLPLVARPFFAPDIKTATLPNYEEKLERLARYGARDPRIVMIGGVPTWTVVLFRRILEITGKANMLEVWPDFQVYIHGGVSSRPFSLPRRCSTRRSTMPARAISPYRMTWRSTICCCCWTTAFITNSYQPPNGTRSIRGLSPCRRWKQANTTRW